MYILSATNVKVKTKNKTMYTLRYTRFIFALIFKYLESQGYFSSTLKTRMKYSLPKMIAIEIAVLQRINNPIKLIRATF